MSFVSRFQRPGVLVIVACGFIFSANDVHASAGVEVYSTGFEASEGYDMDLDLAGQQGWVFAQSPAGAFDGKFANGLLTNAFPTSKQQAYIGFDPSSATNASLYLWQPIGLDPVPPATPVIQFNVAFAIIDSTTGEYDNFTFEVFNAQGDSLVAVDFDNFALEARYALNGDTSFTPTGIFFENSVQYKLTMTLDFEYNVWSASFSDATNEYVIARGQRISNGDPLSFGDVSILWFNAAGFPLNDNYMVFDDYRIIAYAKSQVQWLGFNDAGDAMVRLFGETGSAYAIELGDAADQWTPVYTNTLTDTFFDYTNANALILEQRFYRGRLVQ